MMERELQELQNFRRKGASLAEYWKFVLHSPTHQQALLATQPEVQTELLFWQKLFSSIENLAHPDPDIQEEAEQFFWRTSDPAIEEVLKEALQHESDGIRKTALFLLSQKPLSQESQRKLIHKMLQDPSAEVRITLLNTFVFQEMYNEAPYAPEILAILDHFLSDENFLVRHATAIFFGGIEKTPEIIQKLQYFLEIEKEETIRMILLHSLNSLEIK